MSLIGRANQIYGRNLFYKDIVSQNGICFGLTISAINQHLNGNLDKWLETHQFISSYKRPNIAIEIKATEDFFKKIIIKAKKDNQGQPLTQKQLQIVQRKLGKHKNKVLQIKAFYDEALLNMSGPKKAKDIFPESAPMVQSDYTTSKLLGSDNWSLNTSQTRLDNKDTFTELIKNFEKLKNPAKFAYSISFMNHIVALIRKENNKWLVINHDEIYEGNNYEKIWQVITKNNIKNEQINCNIKCYTDKEEINHYLTKSQDFSGLTNQDKKQLLLLAISLDDRDAVIQLLNLGTPLNIGYEGLNPLNLAAQQDNPELINILVNNGCDVNQTVNGVSPLSMAIYSNRPRTMQALIDNGAKLDPIQANDLLKLAFTYRNNEVTDILIKNGISITPFLFHFIDDDDTENLSYIIKKGGDVNTSQYGSTLLNEAVYKDNIVAVKIILEGGGNTDEKDIFGVNALGAAIENGNLLILKTLICHIVANKDSEAYIKDLELAFIKADKKISEILADEPMSIADIVFFQEQFNKYKEVLVAIRKVKSNAKQTVDEWNKELSKLFYEKLTHDYEENKYCEDLLPKDNRTLLEKNFIHLAITSVAAVAVFIAILVAPKLIVINMTLAAIFFIAASFSCLKFFIDIKNESLFIERQLQHQQHVGDIGNNHKPMLLRNNNKNIMTPDPKKGNLR